MTETRDRGKVTKAPPAPPATPTPFPPEQLARMRLAHHAAPDDRDICEECYRLWPCQTARLLTMIR